LISDLPFKDRTMTDFNPTVAPTYNKPVDRVTVSSRKIATMGSQFSTLDMVAGIVAALMTLGPLAMAAFAVGR
jgi:hypothetical protein